MNIQQQQAALAALPTDQTAIPILQKIAQGQHPMFPPGTEWMGLAKMNEVKRSMEAAQAMQQSAMAAPQGNTTVRDQVQQGVAALAQQQAQQQQMQQAVLSGKQPPGVPQMAAGGAVARYAGGGLTPYAPYGFANMQRMSEEERQAVKEQMERGGGADPGGILALLAEAKRALTDDPRYPWNREAATKSTQVSDKERDKLRRMDRGEPAAPAEWTGGRLSPAQVQAMLASDSGEVRDAAQAYLRAFPDGDKSEPRPAPAQGGGYEVAEPRSAPAPSGIAAVAARRAELPTYTPEMPEDPVAARKALMAGEPALQGDPQADRKAYAELLARREQEMRARNEGDSPDRQREAWTRKLLAAANAAGSQGGLRGIAAALGGYGAQAAKESDYNRSVRESQISAQQALEDLRIKYQQETAAAERAAAEGRISEALKHRENMRVLREQANKLKYEAQLKVYEKDRDSEEKALDRENRLEQQRLANQGSLATASVRADSGSDRTVRAMTAVQQVLNNNPEYKELAKTASMAPNSPMGRQAAARMQVIEQQIIRRFAPELLESTGAPKPGVPDLSGWGQPKLVQ